MGEPFLNLDNIKKTIDTVNKLYNPNTHHYISTIGIKGSDFSWIAIKPQKSDQTRHPFNYSFIDYGLKWLY